MNQNTQGNRNVMPQNRSNIQSNRVNNQPNRQNINRNIQNTQRMPNPHDVQYARQHQQTQRRVVENNYSYDDEDETPVRYERQSDRQRSNTGILVVSILLIIIVVIVAIGITISSFYNDAKRVDGDSIASNVTTSKQEEVTPEIVEEEHKETPQNTSTYVSPYSENYGKSLETVMVDAIKNTDGNIYKSILSNCELMGYQISLSTSNGYTISSRGTSIDSLNLIVDNTTDSVKSAVLDYAGMLSLTYNPNSTKGEYIFENTEQGEVEYFDNITEATDTLMTEINSHKYDPNAVLLGGSTGMDWASTVTPDTDTTSFNGSEPLDSIKVPAYFDANFYRDDNQDVVAILGSDPRELYRHYMMFGKAEGRRYSLTPYQPGQVVQKVYITSVGNHYHKGNCKYIEGDVNEVSLDYVNQNGYSKCPICNP